MGQAVERTEARTKTEDAAGDPKSDDPTIVALRLELESVADRWHKQRIRLSTLHSDGSMQRPSGLKAFPATVIATAAAAWLVRWTIVTKQADGLAFPVSLVAVAIALYSWAQLYRAVAYAVFKQLFLSRQRALRLAIEERAAGRRG
jgi:hypothetical protein